MKLTIKNYKIGKTKKYFKDNKIFFFANGVNCNSLDWLLIKQKLKTIGFNSHKILNKTTVQTLNMSIYNKISPVVKGAVFAINPQQNIPFLKQTVLTTFTSLYFELLMFKFNNKAYPTKFLSNTCSLNYKQAKLLFYQFNLVYVKAYPAFSK